MGVGICSGVAGAGLGTGGCMGTASEPHAPSQGWWARESRRIGTEKAGAVESGVVTAGAGTGSGVVCRAAAKGSLAFAISGVVGTGVAEELAPKKPGAVESGVVTAGAGTGSGVVCRAAAKGSLAFAISGVVGTGVAEELAPKKPGAVKAAWLRLVLAQALG